MITFFTLPKPFSGQAAIHQRNAIHSWLALPCEKQVILLGNEPGIAEAASDLGALYLPDVRCNEYGTPLLDHAFALARKEAENPWLCYVNADIILLSDFIDAYEAIRMKQFMMVGRRWNIEVEDVIDFSSPWENDLRMRVDSGGTLSWVNAIDFFLFPANRFARMPAFAVGRPAWDNWMLAEAFIDGLPVVDVTKATTVIHQNHHYNHVADRRDDRWNGPEGDKNLQLAGKIAAKFGLKTARYMLTAEKALFRARLDSEQAELCLEALLLRVPRQNWLARWMTVGKHYGAKGLLARRNHSTGKIGERLLHALLG